MSRTYGEAYKAEVLGHLAVHGVRSTLERYDVPRSTLFDWQRRARDEAADAARAADLAGLVPDSPDEKKAGSLPFSPPDPLARLVAGRDAALARMLELISSPEADLRQVTGAFKILNDALSWEKLLAAQDDDDERRPSSVRRDAAAAPDAPDDPGPEEEPTEAR